MVTKKIAYVASNFSIHQVYQQFRMRFIPKKLSAILVCCIAALSNFEDQ